MHFGQLTNREATLTIAKDSLAIYDELGPADVERGFVANQKA